MGGAVYLYITFIEKLSTKLGYKDPAKLGCFLYVAILLITILIMDTFLVLSKIFRRF